MARLELVPEELPRAMRLREEVQQRVREAGYRYVAVDLGGFRSGSLNEGRAGTTAQDSLIDVVQVYEGA